MMRFKWLVYFFILTVLTSDCNADHDSKSDSISKHRIIVSTDIGGTDFDDFQSMVHVLLYADTLDIEGLISSPYGPGRKGHILQVIEHYETDYANLLAHSEAYPTPDALRGITKQGEIKMAPYAGYRQPTEGSNWIIKCARREDTRPLHILVWGGLEDLAQALHDAPDILPKLRVYYIGGPNKKWSPDAYHYIANNHRDLFFIEANSTYRGWFVGGKQTGKFANDQFALACISGHGALGDFFASGIEFDGSKRTVLKMGDTPTVAWVLHGDPSDPSSPSWGGSFVKAWARPHAVFDRITQKDDEMEAFGILELVLPIPVDSNVEPTGIMQVENQKLLGYAAPDHTLRFRFCPKVAKTYQYVIHSNVASLEGKKGQITSLLPDAKLASHPSPEYSNWWTDNPAPEFAVDGHHGAQTVSRWREDFLNDFAERIQRCEAPTLSTP